ncbi:hypothetical protein NMG29_36275 [Streptomyces cocklensis]|uniref:Gram-positive cocci surface proteins LPxTG domain-containing protein n=1 Tax=Actinacidiphila cocklensis TaxID=887465 RepID=A0A9W4DJ84_9ACTN|nr:hypothetical protein [Actinacidiphila cocklensis]MDD1063559.1 hypothetical protein [Actinacidiphila cocklensis]CAG6391028.1 conserved exported hypothetical protein [Actinacidiphila cocklensis]
MRARTLVAALGCTAALAVVGTGTALADGGATPAPVPSAAGTDRTHARPATGSRPAATPGQVRAVPAGAPDTGVPSSAAGTSGTARTTMVTGAGVLVAGAGALVLRRRLQGRG